MSGWFSCHQFVSLDLEISTGALSFHSPPPLEVSPTLTFGNPTNTAWLWPLMYAVPACNFHPVMMSWHQSVLALTSMTSCGLFIVPVEYLITGRAFVLMAALDWLFPTWLALLELSHFTLPSRSARLDLLCCFLVLQPLQLGSLIPFKRVYLGLSEADQWVAQSWCWAWCPPCGGGGWLLHIHSHSMCWSGWGGSGLCR